MTTEAVYGAIMVGGERNHPGAVGATSDCAAPRIGKPADAGTAFIKDHEAPLCERLSDEVRELYRLAGPGSVGWK